MTLPGEGRRETISQLASRLLDQGYTQATSAVLHAITSNGTSGLMAQRLRELDAHVADLVAKGLVLRADDPVLRALLADLDTTLRADEALMASAAGTVQQSGVDAAGPIMRQLSLPGLTDEMLAGLGIQWNVPNPAMVARLVDYAESEAWRGMVNRFGEGVWETVRNVAIRGALEGWGPERIAREVRGLVEGLPTAQANTLFRTLQLTSYRDAQVAHRLANADILSYHIRVAALDGSCLACIALHGTRLELGERVDDHWNGRCTSITVIKGRPDPDIQTGEEWFGRQSPARQAAMMGPGAYEAWQAGDVQLMDFVHRHTDPVFGGMVSQASLTRARGD
jgi:hypothetical protein